MLRSKSLRILIVLTLVTLSVAQIAAAAEGIQVIIVRDLAAGVKGFSSDDVVRAGGHVDGWYGDHVVVTVPSGDIAALRGLAGVKYIQEVVPAGAATRSRRQMRATTERLHSRAMIESASTFAYGYDGSGNIYAIGTPGGIDTYEYDPLSRLKTATLRSISASEVENYTYDEYGNLTQRTGTGAPGMIAVTANSNHLANGAAYDEAGNLLSWATETYVYDADNMLIQKTAAGREEDYAYDADGERIGVRNPNSVSGDSWTWSFRGFDNHVLREYQSSNGAPGLPWSWVEDYVYRDGSLLATDRMAELGGRRDMHLDHLGTPRLITDSDGNIAVDRELRPFGSHTTTAAITQDIGHGFDREEPMAFTGHERDYTPDPIMYTDYMHGREYTPQWGRFFSVDPNIDEDTKEKPQKWNRYAYVHNNPLGFTDPNGRAENDFRCVECATPEAKKSFDEGIDMVMRPVLRVSATVGIGLLLHWASGGLADDAIITPDANPSSDTPPRPSIDDPNSWRGADPEDLRKAIPPGWGPGEPTKRDGGTRFSNPEKRGEAIRIMPGTPDAHSPDHAGPYAKFSRDGKVTHVPLAGNPSLPSPPPPAQTPNLLQKIKNFFLP